MKKLNHRTKVVILTVVIFLLLAAIYACGILIPDDAITGSFLNAKQSPGFKHPFGTDALGRDLFLRTLKGLSVSITVGLAASVISAVVAVLVGIVAATGSKRIDAVINWVIDLVMGVPHTILIILISFSLGRGLKGLLIGIASTHWCFLARLIRGEVLQLRSQQYVAVSRKLGKSSGWICCRTLSRSSSSDLYCSSPMQFCMRHPFRFWASDFLRSRRLSASSCPRVCAIFPQECGGPRCCPV